MTEAEQGLVTVLAEAVKIGVEAERERCARLAESFPNSILQFVERPGGPPGNYMRASTGTDIASAIRRGIDTNDAT